MNGKIILAVGLLGLVLFAMVASVLTLPCTVESHQFVPVGDGKGFIEEPVTLHTMLWAKLLWDAGYDLYYESETGFAMPGSF